MMHNKKSMDRMKAFVTEKYITIEQKYQPKRTLHSIHRFFAATNHEHFGNVELDDRRLVFLNISNEYQENHKFFKVLCPNLISICIAAHYWFIQHALNGLFNPWI